MKKLIAALLFFNSLFSFSQEVNIQEDNNIYSENKLTIKPNYPNGKEKLNAYLSKNLIKAGFQNDVKTKSKIYAMFIVEKDGSLTSIKIIGKVESRKSDELIRIFKTLPKWNAGKQNGKIVRVQVALPILTNG